MGHLRPERTLRQTMTVGQPGPGTTRRFDPWPALIAAVAVAQVAALVVWLRRVDAAHSEDFDAHYAAAKLLLSGHRDSMYSLAAQLGALDAAGHAAFRVLNPAGWGPVAIATVLPFSYLPLSVAVVLWTALQGGALAVAAVMAVRGSRDLDATGRLLALAALLAAPGVTAMLVLGQWEGLAAVLLVLTWADIARGHAWRSAIWLAFLAGGLPQLAVGVVVFEVALFGWRQVGRLAGCVAVLSCAALGMLGSSGFSGWLHQVAALGKSVRSADTDGMVGLGTGVLGSGAAGWALAAAGIAVAVATCFAVGRRARRTHISAATALGVSAFSLLLSPHLFHYGLAILAPLAVVAFVDRRDLTYHHLMIAAWSALGVLSVSALRSETVGWQPLVPLTLVALAAVATWPALRTARGLQLVTAPRAAELTEATYLAKTPRG